MLRSFELCCYKWSFECTKTLDASFRKVFIFYACQYGHLEVLKVLIDNDPNAMNIDKIGHYTIWTAACNAKIEVLKYLKERLNRDFFLGSID